jgi:hypothetical protein
MSRETTLNACRAEEGGRPGPAEMSQRAMRKKIRPIDIPEDLVQELSEALKTDTATAADMIAWMANVVRDAVIDFDTERFFDRTRRDIALGYLNWPAPRSCD